MASIVSKTAQVVHATPSGVERAVDCPLYNRIESMPHPQPKLYTHQTCTEHTVNCDLTSTHVFLQYSLQHHAQSQVGQNPHLACERML